MARIAKNKLTIEPTADNKGMPSGFRLFGFFNGKKIRKAGQDLNALEALKASLENSQLAMDNAEQARQTQRTTWLSVDQIRDAETAFRARGDQTFRLLDYVNTAKPLMSGPAPMLATDAMTKWADYLTATKKSHATIRNNKRAVRVFLKEAKVKMLGEITPQMVDEHVLNPNLSIGGQVGRAAPIRAWLNFCASRKPAWLRSSPFNLNLREMCEQMRRQKSEDKILTPAQCEALLVAAIKHKKGLMVPFVLLSLWCFMRAAEVRNTNPKDIRLNGKSVVQVWGRKHGGKFRVVNIPDNIVPLLKECFARDLLTEKMIGIPYNLRDWATVRANAGLITVIPGKGRNPKIINSVWQEHILRHTGESYLYQKTGDISLCTNQAGHSKEVAFKHYLQLPAEGASEQFYAITGRLTPLPLEQTG